MRGQGEDCSFVEFVYGFDCDVALPESPDRQGRLWAIDSVEGRGVESATDLIGPDLTDPDGPGSNHFNQSLASEAQTLMIEIGRS